MRSRRGGDIVSYLPVNNNNIFIYTFQTGNLKLRGTIGYEKYE